MSACPTLAELFDLARQGRATGPVLVKRPARRPAWEDRAAVDKLMRQRPVGRDTREERTMATSGAVVRTACVVCGAFIPDQLECPRCRSVCCPGCRERHAPDCSGRPGVGPEPRTELLADVLARKGATR